MNKVSVIIAAYNVEKYIAETVNSVVAQTLKDIEIIIVDDCSTDGTFEIISKLAALDSRIKIVRHEKNRSVNVSRISGLKSACGEYVMYLDGDDCLASDACEKAYNAIKSENVDMLGYDLEIKFTPPVPRSDDIEKEHRTSLYSLRHKAISASKAGLLDQKAVGDIISFTIWDKIYKRELLTKAAAFVPEEYLNMAEDVLYSFLIQYHAHSYSYLPEKLYKYRFGCGMSTTPKLTERLLKFIAKNAYVYNYLNEWIRDCGAETEAALALRRVHKQLYTHIVGSYLYRITEDQQSFFISEISKYGNISDLVLGFSSFIYEHNVQPEQIAKKCAGLDIFASKRDTAKTVGVYYFRVFNGGIEKVISLLTDRWVKAGYRVVLFTDEEPSPNDYYINPEIKRVTVPAMKKKDFFNLKERIEVFRKALIDNGVDVMVYNAWNSPELTLDEMIIKSCGVNLIIHTHNMFCICTDSSNGTSAHYHSSLYKLYAFADSIVTTSDVDNAYWQSMGFRALKTKNPIEYNINVETAPLNGNELLFVARISREKRVIDAIKIAELVRKEIPSVHLTVIGNGDEEAYIKEVNDYISDNGLEALVNMAGFQSNTLPYYQSADIQLVTSNFEGFCLAIMEGKMSGLPLVSYELKNLDISRDSKGMVTVPQEDITAAANAVIRILKDPSLKKEMGLLARKSAEDFFDIDLTERWNEIFTETLLPKPAKKPLSEFSPLEIAMQIAMDNYSRGIALRTQCNNTTSECAALKNELERFKASESYRIGKIVTAPLRAIKRILKRLLRA